MIKIQVSTQKILVMIKGILTDYQLDNANEYIQRLHVRLP